MTYERRGAAGWKIHPGEILRQEFLKPLELSGYALAKSLAVAPQAVNDILLRKRGISADMAVRLGKFFDTTPEFWMNLQAAYELAVARRNLRSKLSKISSYRKAA
jgi:addiction module HigA family antidote